eukprot:349635-Chlamydomonas_euryale.AAC.4
MDSRGREEGRLQQEGSLEALPEDAVVNDRPGRDVDAWRRLKAVPAPCAAACAAQLPSHSTPQRMKPHERPPDSVRSRDPLERADPA